MNRIEVGKRLPGNGRYDLIEDLDRVMSLSIRFAGNYFCESWSYYIEVVVVIVLSRIDVRLIDHP